MSIAMMTMIHERTHSRIPIPLTIAFYISLSIHTIVIVLIPYQKDKKNSNHNSIERLLVDIKYTSPKDNIEIIRQPQKATDKKPKKKITALREKKAIPQINKEKPQPKIIKKPENKRKLSAIQLILSAKNFVSLEADQQNQHSDNFSNESNPVIISEDLDNNKGFIQLPNNRYKVRIKNMFGKIQCFEVPEKQLLGNWQTSGWILTRC